MRLAGRQMIKLSLLFLLLTIYGCVSVNSVPDSASEISFTQAVDEMTGWRTYEKSHTFQDTSYDLVYRAARGALKNANYEITKASSEKGAIIGEHGTTWMHWERVAGIYLKQHEADVQLRIIVKTAVDPTSVPDTTMSVDADKVLEGMRLYIDTEKSTEAAGAR